MKEEEYRTQILQIYTSVPDDRKDAFMSHFTSQMLKPTSVFGWSAYAGYLGIDRFKLGDTGLGVVKLLTLGGLFVWWLVDLFIVLGKAREKNIELAREIASST